MGTVAQESIRDTTGLFAGGQLTRKIRVLIVDDFLSSGSSQEALLRIVSSCPGAHAVGIGVLLEC